MVYKLQWTEQAVRDLKEIRRYYEEHDPNAIVKVLSLILTAADGLATTPFIGDIRKRRGTKEYRESMGGRYRIFFSVEENIQQVIIQRLRHSARGNLKSKR